MARDALLDDLPITPTSRKRLIEKLDATTAYFVLRDGTTLIHDEALAVVARMNPEMACEALRFVPGLENAIRAALIGKLNTVYAVRLLNGAHNLTDKELAAVRAIARE